jgi:hypothetical protein
MPRAGVEHGLGRILREIDAAGRSERFAPVAWSVRLEKATTSPASLR